MCVCVCVSPSYICLRVISGFRRAVDDNCALLGYHTASSGIDRYDIFVNCKWVATRWQLYSTLLHTFRTNDSVQPIGPNFRIQESKIFLNMGPICCTEKSVSNYHYSLRKNPEQRSCLLFRLGHWILLYCLTAHQQPFTGDAALDNEKCRKVGRRLERNLDPRGRGESGKHWAVSQERPRKFTASSKSNRLKRFQNFLTQETGDCCAGRFERWKNS